MISSQKQAKGGESSTITIDYKSLNEYNDHMDLRVLTIFLISFEYMLGFIVPVLLSSFNHHSSLAEDFFSVNPVGFGDIISIS